MSEQTKASESTNGVHIEFSGGFLLTADSLNWIISRQHAVDPKKSPNWARMKADGHDGKIRYEWREESFHAKLADALSKIADVKMRESDARTLTELLTNITEFRREISVLTDGVKA